MQVVTEPRSGSGEFRRWVEHLRVPALSVGTYRIVAGGTDDQQPHAEDEIYVVQAGRARLVAGDGSVAVGPGSVVFVPAGEVHPVRRHHRGARGPRRVRTRRVRG